jgi:hypothetical protein
MITTYSTSVYMSVLHNLSAGNCGLYTRETFQNYWNGIKSVLKLEYKHYIKLYVKCYIPTSCTIRFSSVCDGAKI